MKSKLTLSIDGETLELAKDYAKRNGQDLSVIVENYLSALTRESNKNLLAPKTKKLFGSISLPSDLNSKAEYGDFLLEKHR